MASVEVTDYDRERQQRIAANLRFFAALNEKKAGDAKHKADDVDKDEYDSTKRSTTNGASDPGTHKAGGETSSSCHHCRQKTSSPKVQCTKEIVNSKGKKRMCSVMLDESCLTGRYSDTIPDATSTGEWICPKCRGVCNCSVCRRKKRIQQEKAESAGSSSKVKRRNSASRKRKRATSDDEEDEEEDIEDTESPRTKRRRSNAEAESVEERRSSRRTRKVVNYAELESAIDKALVDVADAPSSDHNDEGEDEQPLEGVEMEVEAILRKRIIRREIDGKLTEAVEYLIKWKGLSADDNTWEPYDNIKEGCKELLAEFEATHKAGM